MVRFKISYLNINKSMTQHEDDSALESNQRQEIYSFNLQIMNVFVAQLFFFFSNKTYTVTILLILE